MKSEVSHTPQVRTKQLRDGDWKAWVVGERMVAFAESQRKAVKMVELILGNRDKDQIHDPDDAH